MSPLLKINKHLQNLMNLEPAFSLIYNDYFLAIVLTATDANTYMAFSTQYGQSYNQTSYYNNK